MAKEPQPDKKADDMWNKIAGTTLVLLCFAMAAAIGGGHFEQTVLIPQWSASPPSSFSIIQPGTGVPLQNFWIPVHSAITVFLVLSLVLAWRQVAVRRLLLVGVASYVLVRGWSAVFFIPEMLSFQQIPLDSPASTGLSARVESWIFWTWFRTPLDVISFLCFLLALRARHTAPELSDHRRRPVPAV